MPAGPGGRRDGPMPYWHSYVDESGDRGWKRRPADLPPGTRAGSSEHFCLTAVLVPNGAQPAILERWEQVAVEIGRKPSDTIHWTKVRSHPQRLHLCNAVHAVEDLRIISVVFPIRCLDDGGGDGHVSLLLFVSPEKHLAGPGTATDVLGLEDAEVRFDASGAQGVDVALVTGNRSRAARFNVMRQRAEGVDLGNLGAAADGMQHELARRTDVEPSALDASLAPYLSHGMAGPQKEEAPGIATPGGPGSRSPAGDERFIWCHRRRRASMR
jgi:hypothetical protein